MLKFCHWIRFPVAVPRNP